MEVEKGFKGSPFGSQMSRFDIAGIHPKRKLPGTVTQISKNSSNPKMGPGTYDIITYNSDWSERALQAKAAGPGWKRAYETSRLSAMPHLLYKEQWEQNLEQKRKLGPGTYNISDFLEDAEKRPRCKRGHLDILEPRFPKEKSDSTPGPGIYGEGGVPHARKEMADQLRRSVSTVGLLENGGTGERSLPATGCLLGPGTYEIRSSTDILLNKKTSLRGPYDLYSGDRNKPIREGHFAAPVSANLNGGPGQYELKSSLQELESQQHRNQGKFLKNKQYPEKPHDRIYWFVQSQVPPDLSNQVSPCTYNPKNPCFEKCEHGNNLPPFLSNVSRSDKRALQYFTQNYNSVGAGRYDIQRLDEIKHVFSHQNDFISKSERPTAEDEKIMKKRLRPTNIPPYRKTKVDHISTSESPSCNLENLQMSKSLRIC